MVIYLWGRLTKNISDYNFRKQSVVLPNDFSNGVNLQKDFIIIKNGDKIKVFSSRCSHLGCRINNVNQNIFTCPCHGSQFDLNGNPIKGPAAKNLTALNYKIDKDKNLITISL